MWFTAVRLSPNSGCLGISDSCTHFIQCTSLYDRQTQSVCPSMPPTTHIRLYKSYINASSTHFWWWTSQLHLSTVHHTQSIHVFLRPTQTSARERTLTGTFQCFSLLRHKEDCTAATAHAQVTPTPSQSREYAFKLLHCSWYTHN